jgi:O-methyltransferase
MTTIDHYVEDRREFFRKAFIALGFNGIAGDYAEFGCYTGTTFGLAYEEYQKADRHLAFLPYRLEKGRRFWALDSFRGLPPLKGPTDQHPAWTPGSLATDVAEFRRICAEKGIPDSAYEIVEGYYEETLVGDTLGRQLPENIALAYVDCDLHSSILTVLRFLLPRLKHGMILALDDYFVYSSAQVSGARRAAVDVFADDPNWRLLPYVQFAWGGMSFIIESKQILGVRRGLGSGL